MITRKQFFKSSLLTLSGGILFPTISFGLQEDRPQLDKSLVQKFVYEAHFNLDNVKGMLEETPDLLLAVHNVGTWDWEDAVGAAGHMGQREMALFLLDKGARMTIHVAAMLGELDIVKAMINAYPKMKHAKGPHNISLLQHAKYGKEPAEKVVEYLSSIGIKE